MSEIPPGPLAMRVTARVAAVTALAALAFSGRAVADPVPATVRLAWVRGADADECPDALWMHAEVTRRLRRDPFDDDGPRSIEAVVERASQGWRATLRVRDRDGSSLGERTLTHDGPRCAAMADASALAIALAVDPDAVVEPALPVAPAAPRRPRAPRRTPAPAPQGPWLTVGVVGGVSVGVTPSPAAVVGVAGSVETASPWSARLRVDTAPGVRSADGNFEYGFTRATAFGCGAPWRATQFVLTLCAGVSGAFVHAAVRRARALDAGDQPWLAATAAVGLRWSPSPRWFLALDVDGSVAIVRSKFLYSPDAGVIETQPLGSGGASLTVGLRAP